MQRDVRYVCVTSQEETNKQTWRTTVCKYTVCSVQYFVKNLASLKQLSLFRDNLVSFM